jgi:hypothetical protein
MWRGGFRLNIFICRPFVRRCLSGSTVTPFPHPAHRTGRADFSHPASMGLSLPFSVKVSRHFCLPLSFHSFVRPAPRSILPPRPHISIAVARSGGQPVETPLPISIALIDDPAEKCSGPIWLHGGIAHISADGFAYEGRNRMTLCRCGASQKQVVLRWRKRDIKSPRTGHLNKASCHALQREAVRRRRGFSQECLCLVRSGVCSAHRMALRILLIRL